MLRKIWNNREGRTVIENYGALLFIQGANFILPLVVLPYLVQTLGAEKYGIVVIAQSMALFLSVIVDFGFSISATRETSLMRDNKERLSQLFWNVMAIKIALVTLMFLLVVILILSVSRFKIELEVYLFSYLMVLGQALFPAWLFQGLERMKVVSIVNVSAKIIFTAAVLVVIVAPDDYEYVPLLQGGGFVIAGMFGFGYALRFVDFRKPKLEKMKSLLQQSSSLVVANFATSIYNAGNTFILGMIGGDVAAGIYASMEKLLLACKNVFAPLYQALFPWLAKKEDLATRTFIKKASTPIAVVALLISLLFLIFSKEILDFTYANEEISSYHYALKIISGIALFSALNMLLVSLYFPSRKEYTTRMIILVSGGVFNLIVAVIAAVYYDVYGVAIAAVLSEFFILSIAFLFYTRKLKKISL